MAVLNITEYSDVGEDWKSQKVQAGREPSLNSQALSYSTNAVSEVLHNKCRFVRLIADADCHFVVGESPVATAANTRLEANVAEYFTIEIIKDRLLKIAAYDGSS